jgi:hypothetical protein
MILLGAQCSKRSRPASAADTTRMQTTHIVSSQLIERLCSQHECNTIYGFRLVMQVAAIRGWRVQRLLHTPMLLKMLCGEGGVPWHHQAPVLDADVFGAAAAGFPGDGHAHHD